jgi:hypothetical protein
MKPDDRYAETLEPSSLYLSGKGMSNTLGTNMFNSIESKGSQTSQRSSSLMPEKRVISRNRADSQGSGVRKRASSRASFDPAEHIRKLQENNKRKQ